MLRFAGREVDVQNYIDNTGVQVADVVVGFLNLERKTKSEVEQLSRHPRFDYYCWDLYARVSQWYEQDKQNLAARQQALHAIEQGNNETVAIADLMSIAVLRRHLETMDRLDIEYDFLPRESEILHLHFWDAAFTKLKEAGVLLSTSLTALIKEVAQAAVRYKYTLMVGRTHGIHAEPMTFGLKLALWVDELRRGQQRLAAALEQYVGRLEVAVHDAAIVHRLQGQRDLVDQLDDPPRRCRLNETHIDRQVARRWSRLPK